MSIPNGFGQTLISNRPAYRAASKTRAERNVSDTMNFPPRPYSDPYLPSDAMSLAALDIVCKTGRLDALFEGSLPEKALGPVLTHLLIEGGVIEITDKGRIALQPDFAKAWSGSKKDLGIRVDFARRAMSDIVSHLETLCFSLPDFMRESSTFQLFRYDRAMTETDADLEHTRRWVSYVEALSRLEAPALAQVIDLGNARHLLEIGGNTGLMAEALLDRYLAMEAVVMDLPAVCALGRARAGDRARLRFEAADARTADWPAKAGAIDAVLFKSVLHDWPETEALALLDKAVMALPPGGRVVVAERGPIRAETGQGLRAADAANMVFAPFFRDPVFYMRALEGHGLRVACADLRLDMAWHVITGIRV